MKRKLTKMTWDEFAERFKPQKNYRRDNASIGDGWGYETYGEELDYVRSFVITEPKRVWTVMDDDQGAICIRSGYHYVNRLNYIITEIPRPKNEKGFVQDPEDVE